MESRRPTELGRRRGFILGSLSQQACSVHGMADRPFSFVDLFAGIGGFHAALAGIGGECLLASEIDPFARAVYEGNWGTKPVGDIYDFVTPQGVLLPRRNRSIDLLVAGFPCQPFSKSGKQLGMTEERGTLFETIIQFADERRPRAIVLENVRNLAGPRHRHEFEFIIESLRESGYVVSETPAIFSPHRIAPQYGGRPQIRERLFITATRNEDFTHVDPGPIRLDPDVVMHDVNSWAIDDYLIGAQSPHDDYVRLTSDELRWLTAWEAFLRVTRRSGVRRLPGHPLWSDCWTDHGSRRVRDRMRAETLDGVPAWKANFLRSNWTFYDDHKNVIDGWKEKFAVEEFPASRRKFEWQAQDENSIWNCAIHLRPSGIRVKKPTYLPAFVAMNQTSVLGPQKRRVTTAEVANLQGLPEWFDFGDQPVGQTYKQLGNAVNVGVVWQVLRAHVNRDRDTLSRTAPRLVSAVDSAPLSPDERRILAASA